MQPLLLAGRGGREVLVYIYGHCFYVVTSRAPWGTAAVPLS
jgi:hypothetical protein